MIALSRFLKLFAPIFVLVGILHLILGPGADVLLGARLPANVISHPVLDSQNRFYGVVFSVYGFLLFLCATDLVRYAPVFNICIWVFFAGGVARVISIAQTTLPSAPVLALLAAELLLAPVLALCYRQARRRPA